MKLTLGFSSCPNDTFIFDALVNKKFDPEEKYIQQWVPEYKSTEYPFPIVQHKFARERCMAVYKKALSQKHGSPIQTNLFDGPGQA